MSAPEAGAPGTGAGAPAARAPHPLVPWVLVSCTAVSILSTDLYTPSLPHLPAVFGTSAETVQLTMSLNLAAYAGAQLLHGPLADRFGRRRLLMLGFLGFLLASLACALALDIAGLLAGRIAQGLCSSVASVVVLLMIRELYDDERAVRLMGLYGFAVGMVPAVGPLIGGYIHVYAGWRANFAVLAVLAAAVVLLILRWLPESGTRDPEALRAGRIVANYRRLLGLPAYLRYLLPLTLQFGAIFAFITAGPFVLIDRLGVPTQHYGLCYGAIVLAYMVGSLTVARLASRLPAERIVHTSVLISPAGGLVLLLPLLLGHESLVAILLGMSLFAAGLGLVLASAPICLLAAAGEGPRGPAVALCGSLQLAAASLAGLLVGSFHDGTALPLAWTTAGFTLAGAVGYFMLGRCGAR